jgi:hypothetical protein
VGVRGAVGGQQEEAVGAGHGRKRAYQTSPGEPMPVAGRKSAAR